MTIRIPARMERGQRAGACSADVDVVCPQCGVVALVARQCKSVCEQCGYVESCEDNFVPNMANPREQHVVVRDLESDR